MQAAAILWRAKLRLIRPSPALIDNMPTSQMTKLEAMGNATRWHG